MRYGELMIVDAHAHIYSPDEQTYPTVEQPYRPPAGTGTPERLREEMRTAGVDAAMFIQTSTFYGWDNSFIRDASTAAREWATGVCTLNPDDPHSPDVLYALVQRSNVRALRAYVRRSGGSPSGGGPSGGGPSGSGLPEGGFDHAGNRRLFAEARRLGIVVNALLSVRDADGLLRLLRDFPDLPVVIDHCLALQAGPTYEPTVAKMLEIAGFPNAYAKLSFLPTGSAQEYPFRDMHDACRRFVDAFGPDRCLWGSDYPTELWCPRTTYRGHLDLFRQALGLSAAEQAAILGGTAQRLYRLST